MIVLEGPDGAGKSTLAAILKEITGYSLVSNSYKDPCDFLWFSKQLERKDTIFDRTFISEVVYSKAMNKEIRLKEKEIYLLQRQLIKRKAVVLYCTNQNSLLKDRAFERGEGYVDKNQLVAASDLYEEYFTEVLIPKGISVIKINLFLNLHNINNMLKIKGKL